MTERPRARRACPSGCRRARRRGPRRWAGTADTIASATARGAFVAAAPVATSGPQRDPDVDPPAGDRSDPDITVAQDSHPGVAARVRVRVGEVVGQPDPRVETSRTGDSNPARDDRVESVGADDDRGAERGGPPVGAADGGAARSVGRRRSRASRAGHRRPRVTARSRSAGSSRDRSKPTAGSPPVSAP